MEPPSVSDSGSAAAPPGTPDSSSADVNHCYVPDSNPSSAATLQCDLGRAVNPLPTYQAAQIKREKAPSFAGALGEGADRKRERCGRKEINVLTKAIAAAFPQLYFKSGRPGIH